MKIISSTQVWLVLKGSHSFTCHPHVYPRVHIWFTSVQSPQRLGGKKRQKKEKKNTAVKHKPFSIATSCVLTRNDTVLPATHSFIHKWNEPSCLYSPAAYITAVWMVLIFHPTEGRKPSWPGWLVTYRGGMPVQTESSIPVPIN